MDNYDEDFEEEIVDESENFSTQKNQKSSVKKGNTSGTGSQQDIKNQIGARGSVRETDRNTRNGVRKTVPLSKQSIKKDSEEYYAAPLKNITNTKSSTKNKRSNSYDEDEIEDEVANKHMSAVKSESPKAVGKKLRLKEFDIEGLGIRGSLDKRSAHSTPRSRTSTVINYSYYDRFRDILESDVTGKSMKELEGENSKLRDNLKDLNEQLTKIIERSRVATLAPKVVEFKNKNAEDKLRTIEKEMANNKQITEFTYTEYITLKTKLDKIKGATYLLDLEDKIADAISKTEAIRKENKTLSLAAGNIAKDLKNIDTADGMAPALIEANEKAKELAVAKRKLKKLQDMNADLDDESQTKKAKYEKVQNEYKKLISDAEQFKVTAEDNKLANRQAQLQAQVKSLEDYIKFATNNNEKYLKNQLEKNIEELYINNLKEGENAERLGGMIEEQKAVLREMIEKQEQKGDRQIVDIVSKIKNSIDTAKFITEPDFGNEKPSKVKSLTNIQPKTTKKALDMYADLPLFTPNAAKGESVPNKKLTKREMNAIKESAKREDRSKTPEAKPQQSSDSKPMLRAKDKKEEPVKQTPRAEPEKLKMQEVESEDKPNKGNAEGGEVSMKPSFSKPSFAKKNKDPVIGGENLQLSDKPLGNQEPLTLGGGNQPLTLGGGNQPLTLGGGNQPLTLGGGGNQPLTLGGGNQNLTLGGKNQPLTLGGGLGQNKSEDILKIPSKNEPLTLGNDTKGGLSLNQGGFGAGNKKDELSLPGQLSSNKNPLEKKNQELNLDNNFKLQPTSNKAADDDDNFEIGGLSRLNKARKGAGPGIASNIGDPAKKEELSLPGQKPAGFNAGGLTLPGSEQKNVFEYKAPANEPLTLGGSGNNNDFAFGGAGAGAKGGRDRSHLVGGKQEETLTLGGGIKKEPVANSSSNKPGFDPDDIFSSNKPTTKVEPKNEGSVNPSVGGTLGGMGIPGVRSGRGGVAGRPKQVGMDDDDLFGGATNTKPVVNQQGSFGFGGGASETTNKPSGNQVTGFGGGASNQTENKVGGFGGGGFGGGGFGGGGFGGGGGGFGGGGFGGGGFGGAGGAGGAGTGSEANKGGLGLGGGAAAESLGTGAGAGDNQGKRMRMNDLKSKGDATKEKASKAQQGGFFGDFDD